MNKSIRIAAAVIVLSIMFVLTEIMKLNPSETVNKPADLIDWGIIKGMKHPLTI